MNPPNAGLLASVGLSSFLLPNKLADAGAPPPNRLDVLVCPSLAGALLGVCPKVQPDEPVLPPNRLFPSLLAPAVPNRLLDDPADVPVVLPKLKAIVSEDCRQCAVDAKVLGLLQPYG